MFTQSTELLQAFPDLAGLELRDCESVSLGQNCSTATYLKAAGVKTTSYPFDWVFSSPDIVADCVEDGFSSFLDRRLHQPDGANAAGHVRYHTSMFNHHNIVEDETYAYYQRAVSRFLTLWTSTAPVVFFSTALCEHEKRRGWREGFDGAFKAPANQDIPTDYARLLGLLQQREGASHLIVFRETTDTGRWRATLRLRQGNLIWFDTESVGASGGARFKNEEDHLAQTGFVSALLGLGGEPKAEAAGDHTHL